ncbi:keratin-associated protein 6-2-like [Limulus polyphemus]|uniref:Keratin-associated protein 6-2-like n=1 Tax=Limulus polyphemus TaxID=6850 RepID=A0ABM1TEX0_LIMPO|nr:keratin-associated protein 6-2-like [Limulus polyphemus]
MRLRTVCFVILCISCYANGGYTGYGGYDNGASGYGQPYGFKHGKGVAFKTRHHFPGGYGEGAYQGIGQSVHVDLPGGGKAYGYSGGYSMGYGASYGHGAPNHFSGGLGHAVGHGKGYSGSFGYGNPAVGQHALSGLHQQIQNIVHSAFSGGHQGGLFGGNPFLPF